MKLDPLVQELKEGRIHSQRQLLIRGAEQRSLVA
jgi:hypothetical protein